MAENIAGVSINGVQVGVQDSGARQAARAAVHMVRSIADKVEQTAEESSSAVKKAQEMSSEISELITRISTAETIAQNAINKSKSASGTSDGALAKVEVALSKVNKANETASQAQEALKGLIESIKSNTKDIELLHGVMDNLESTYTTLCTNSTELFTQLNLLTQEIPILDKRIQETEGKYDITQQTLHKASVAEEKSVIAEKLASRAENTSAKALLIVKSFEDIIESCNDRVKVIETRCKAVEQKTAKATDAVAKLSEAVTTMNITIESLATKENLSAMGRYVLEVVEKNRRTLEYKKPRWLTYDFQDVTGTSLRVADNTSVAFYVSNDTDSTIELCRLQTTESKTFPMATFMQQSANASAERVGETNGRDYYVYLVSNGATGTLVCSLRKDCPSDIDSQYTALNTLRIGQFATLCADAGDTLVSKRLVQNGSELTVGDCVCLRSYNPVVEDEFYRFYYKELVAINENIATFKHPLAGFKAGMILPESVQCLSWHRKARVDVGAVYYVPELHMGCFVYPQSSLTSRFRAPYQTTEPRELLYCAIRQIGYDMPSVSEFRICAQGGSELSSVKDSLLPLDGIGGHVNSDGMRLLSELGGEELSGILRTYTREACYIASETQNTGLGLGGNSVVCNYTIAGSSFSDASTGGSYSVSILSDKDEVPTDTTTRGVCEWSTEEWEEMLTSDIV